MRDAFEHYWHSVFKFGVFIKGLNGIWETISGFSILLISKTTLSSWFYLLARKEIFEDPNDRFSNFVIQLLQTTSAGTKTFAAIYIIFHGFLNMFLAIQLYRDRHWAYLVTIGATVTFIIYQIHRVVVHHSIFLLALTIFDIFFVVLAWHEYKYHQEQSRKIVS